MSLARFQSAVAELITVPERRRAVRALGSVALEDLELDDRERRRLVALAGDPRLEVAVMLHVRRRLAGVLTALPHTCRLLGDEVVSFMNDYGESHPPRSSYFVEEGLAFADFLRAERKLTGLRADVLALEAAALELELEVERDGDAAPVTPTTALSPRTHPRLAPRSRLVDIWSNPERLADVLRGGPAAEDETSPTRSTLFVQRRRGGELRIEALDPALAEAIRLCTGTETVGGVDPGDDDAAALAEGGYVVFTSEPVATAAHDARTNSGTAPVPVPQARGRTRRL